MSENLSLLSGRKGLENNLFEKLVNHGKSGKVEEGDIVSLAREFLMGEANIYGSSTFYDFLKLENQDKKVHICNGSACMLAGTQDKLKEALSRKFHEDEIGEMTCMGRCHENGAFNLGGRNYSNLSESQLENILQNGSEFDIPDKYFVGSNVGSPIFTGQFPGVDNFYKPVSDLLGSGPEQILKQIKESGLRGRGGAGFPMGIKLEACNNTDSDIKFVVCNADEGDPGAFSDRYLLEKQPHLVLFGMLMAGFVIGANQGVLYIRTEYPESVLSIRNALMELEERNLAGESILGTDFSFYFKVIEGAGSYVCGEETALLSSIEGQRPEVRIRPPYPAQEGLFGKPTLVNNVETLAMVYYILTKGGRAISASPWTKLVCLDSFFNRPGVYGVQMGTPLEEVVNDLGKGFRQPVKALHIGGPLGGIVPVTKIKDLNLDFESFSNEGFLLGHASIICIPEHYPMIKYLEHLFEFTAHESCGKCFPCSLGSVRGKEMMAKAQSDGNYKIDRQLLDDLLETLEIGSLCALGGGLPLGVKNALQYFEEELKEFIC